MKTNMLIAGLSLAGSLAISGCNEDVVATQDPLEGSWSNDGCFGVEGTPADVESCTVTVEFSAELDVTVTATWVSLAATQNLPGCTTTRVVTGQTWSADHTTNEVTLSGKPEATIERSSCVKEADNLAAVATSDIEVLSGSARYEVNADALTIVSGSLAGSYVR